MIPIVEQNKTSLQGQKIDQQLPGTRGGALTEKGQEGTLCGDGNIQYLDCWGGYMGGHLRICVCRYRYVHIYVCHISSTYTVKNGIFS